MFRAVALKFFVPCSGWLEYYRVLCRKYILLFALPPQVPLLLCGCINTLNSLQWLLCLLCIHTHSLLILFLHFGGKHLHVGFFGSTINLKDCEKDHFQHGCHKHFNLFQSIVWPLQGYPYSNGHEFPVNTVDDRLYQIS